MSPRDLHKKADKVKVGITLSGKVFWLLKERSAKEGRPISALIEDAVLQYEQADFLQHEMCLKALDRLLSTRLNISQEDWQAIMDEDVWKQ